MAIEVLPESPGDSEPSASPIPETMQPASAAVSRARWAKRTVVAGLVVAAGVIAVVVVSGAASSDDSRTRMTHTVRRGELIVTVTEQGVLESSENTEIKCKVRGESTVIWVVEGGAVVQPGDELVRLDTLAIEDAIAERTKYAHWSRSGAEHWRARVATAELAISEYEEGRFNAEMMTLEKDLAIAESDLRTARNMRDHARTMFERGYISATQVDLREFSVTQAELAVEGIQVEIDVLNRFTREIELARLRGELSAFQAQLAAAEERAVMDAERRDLALEELEHCVITAPRSGLVIYPSAAEWESAPDIEEGATVHRDQVLLLMPDLTKMQVKVGVHESVVDRIYPGLDALVTLPDRTLNAEVTSVATVTRPAGWWTGNVVKYDTIIQLPEDDRLRPGMSVEVQIIVAQHEDVLTVPVAAVLETLDGDFCWVETEDGPQRRSLKLGDTNDIFVVVEAGLAEGDEVVLNPLAFVEEAQSEVLRPQEEPGAEAGDESDETGVVPGEEGGTGNLESDGRTDVENDAADAEGDSPAYGSTSEEGSVAEEGPIAEEEAVDDTSAGDPSIAEPAEEEPDDGETGVPVEDAERVSGSG